MHSCGFDHDIALIARRQHGVFTTAQARAVGGTRHVLRNRLVHGTVLKLAPTVWAVSAQPATRERQLKAAQLSVRGAAVCDRAAAVVHLLPEYRLGRISIAVPPGSNSRSALAVVRRVADLPVTVVDGIRVTTVAQTLYDLLRCSPLAMMERALDDALLTGKVTATSLQERTTALAGARRPGVEAWRALVDERVDPGWAPPESQLEALLYGVLARLPDDVRVLRQATPPWWPEGTQRVDAYLPDQQLVVEADGRRWHARVQAFDRDRWRDNVAAAHGHRVLRFTHTHLSNFADGVYELVVASLLAAQHRRAS